MKLFQTLWITGLYDRFTKRTEISGKNMIGKFIGTAFYDEWKKCEVEVRFKGKWGG